MEDTTASSELQLGHSTEPNAEGTPDTGTATAGGISPGALLMGHPHFFGDWKEALVNLTLLFSLGMALMSCTTLYPQLNWTPQIAPPILPTPGLPWREVAVPLFYFGASSGQSPGACAIITCGQSNPL